MPGLLQKKEPNPAAVYFNFFLLLFGIVYFSPFITLRKEKRGGGGRGAALSPNRSVNWCYGGSGV